MAREGLVAETVDAALVDAFFDALWLEDGLSKNTLEAYRRDLRLFSGWLEKSASRSLLQAQDADLAGFFAARHATPGAMHRASSDARMLSSLKRFYHYCLREGQLKADPTLIPHLVDEAVRWSSPVKHFMRTVGEDATIGGQPVRVQCGDGIVRHPGRGQLPLLMSQTILTVVCTSHDPEQHRLELIRQRHVLIGVASEILARRSG